MTDQLSQNPGADNGEIFRTPDGTIGLMQTSSIPWICQRCGKWFKPNPKRQGVACAVMHAPGTCCHYSHTEVSEHKETDHER